MSSFNFGGPVMAQIVADETAANRENRDWENLGGDQKYTAVEGGSVQEGTSATLTTVASSATGGRKNRNYGQRPATDHRADYDYVDVATGDSAVTGAKSPTFDEAVANDGLWPF